MPAGVASGTRKRSTSLTGAVPETVAVCTSGGSGSAIARPPTRVVTSREHGRAPDAGAAPSRLEADRQMARGAADGDAGIRELATGCIDANPGARAGHVDRRHGGAGAHGKRQYGGKG